MSRRTLFLFGAATLFGAALMIAPTWASATTTAPTTPNCPDCVTHNSQPGDGSGGFTFQHVCVPDANSANMLPQFVGTFWNPTGVEVRGTIVPWSVGPDGVTPFRQLQTPTGFTAPPHGTTTVTIRLSAGLNHVRFLVWKSTASNGHLTESFDCPCPTAPPTTVTSSTSFPSTSVPSSVPGTGGSTPATTPSTGSTPTQLPATGVDVMRFVGFGVILAALGTAVLLVARRDREAEDVS